MTSLLPRLGSAKLQDVIGLLRETISGVAYEFSVRASNKAAHRTVAVLTLKPAQKDGSLTCVPDEVALLYYLLDDVPEYIVLIGLLKRLWTVYDGAEDGPGREDLLVMVGGWMLGQL